MELAREREHRETAERQFGEEQKIRCKFFLVSRPVCLVLIIYQITSSHSRQIAASKLRQRWICRLLMSLRLYTCQIIARKQK